MFFLPSAFQCALSELSGTRLPRFEYYFQYARYTLLSDMQLMAAKEQCPSHCLMRRSLRFPTAWRRRGCHGHHVTMSQAPVLTLDRDAFPRQSNAPTLQQPKQSKSGIDRYSIPLWPGGGNGA